MFKIFAWRNNTGAYRTEKGCFIRFGLPGSADITGILPSGLRLEIEAKTLKGDQSDNQKVFQQKIEDNNGIYLLVHSPQELLDLLTERGLIG